MQELIYLSRSKLQRFRQEAPPRWRLRAFRGEVGIPGVAQVGMEANVPDIRLDDVFEYVAGISRWYLDDNIVAGQWIQFETRLSYTVRDIEGGMPVVLFADVAGNSGRRLLLHGSAASLVGTQQLVAPTQRAYDASSAAIMPVLVSQAQPYSAIDSRDMDADTVLRSLDDSLGSHTAAAMHGLAMVSMTTSEQMPVVASPLYVAYLRGDQ